MTRTLTAAQARTSCDRIGSLQNTQRIVMGAAAALHAIHPMLIAGCRPIDLSPFLDASRWDLLHTERVSTFGITSAVWIAGRKVE